MKYIEFFYYLPIACVVPAAFVWSWHLFDSSARSETTAETTAETTTETDRNRRSLNVGHRSEVQWGTVRYTVTYVLEIGRFQTSFFSSTLFWMMNQRHIAYLMSHLALLRHLIGDCEDRKKILK